MGLVCRPGRVGVSSIQDGRREGRSRTQPKYNGLCTRSKGCPVDLPLENAVSFRAQSMVRGRVKDRWRNVSKGTYVAKDGRRPWSVEDEALGYIVCAVTPTLA
jgi:hypothetical protein